MDSMEAYLHQQQQRVEAALDRFLPPLETHPNQTHPNQTHPNQTYPNQLIDAMRYSIFAGGKRLRPILVLAATETLGGDTDAVLPAACAVECIHTYSLIHDDLPAMDDDDLRRGKPTNHVVYGEAMAILAGDALLTHAFELLSGSPLADTFDASVLLQASQCLAQASGSLGMVGGQAVDIVSEGQEIELLTLEYMHRHKTAALIEASVVMGGLLGGGSPEHVQALRTYGHQVGWAFQITDDILDVEGDAALLGKAVGRDAEQAKATYPGIIGLEPSRERAKALMQQGLEALSMFDHRADRLRQIADYIVTREL